VVAVRVGVAGIWVTSSNNNTVSGNLVRNSKDIGILLYNSTKNHIVANLISNSGSCSLYLSLSNENNIFHNNLINNPQQVYIENSTNMWDDGYPSGGNYWSDYRGVDLYSGPYENETGNDGLGDMPYVIDANNIDKYPLTAPFKVFEAGVWNGKAYNVDVISNSTVSGFKFDVDNKSVSFNVAGDNGTVGFCRVAIPKSLLWVDDGWIIFVDNQPITDYTEFEDENFTYLYFIYTHSTKTVRIKGTHVIPEYTSTITLIMFMLITIAPVVLTNMRIKSFPNSLNSRRQCQHLWSLPIPKKKRSCLIA
jgi:parallel beta-helix repeat protein